MKKVHSLPHLSAFEAAARLGSFSAAADELFLTTGAISRHIRSLEEQLGITLFYRAHKSVRLTPAGENFSRTASRVISELFAAESALKASAGRQRLVVHSLPTFTMHWLMPKLAAFNEIHPGIAVDITTSTGAVDRNTPFDVAIRRDPAHFSGLKAIPFLQEDSLLVCSQSYLRAMPVSAPDKLGEHTAIRIRAREDLWHSWLNTYPTALDASPPPLTLDHTFAAIQAAEDGLGLAVVPYLFCAKQLSSGRLVSPFPALTIRTGVYSLLLRDRDDEVVRKFAAWLRTYQA
ncbi:LysR substrate-binding domain-containing protein [Serratia marcescens]|uniref:LysR substrate-binding domain-containing protein n=1 Tax=Serratia marcescens TaxID=615 RepID=UPI00148E20AA|nr:LysR substrate-binding domain-containing protein [Serratia marcescens]QJU40121.1 LysR family transcriptional regulator [Serratia marcescens]